MALHPPLSSNAVNSLFYFDRTQLYAHVQAEGDMLQQQKSVLKKKKEKRNPILPSSSSSILLVCRGPSLFTHFFFSPNIAQKLSPTFLNRQEKKSVISGPPPPPTHRIAVAWREV
jgi:hypothetical protein